MGWVGSRVDFGDGGEDTCAGFVGVGGSGFDICGFVFLVEIFDRGVHGVAGLLLGFSLTGTGFVDASSHEFGNEMYGKRRNKYENIDFEQFILI
jgi:hypothetical protein